MLELAREHEWNVKKRYFFLAFFYEITHIEKSIQIYMSICM